MSGLKLRGVSKSFGLLKVIKNVDLEINSKEFVVFVGPSGCGKSTLLRMIAGLEEVSSGDIEIGGQRVNDVDPSQRGIAMVFQTYALYPHLTVRENMGFALRFAGVPKPEIAKQVDEAARMLELGPLMDRRPKELSGGQRQRVAIGRAIVRHPQVFLFDEPLSNLDAELRVHMRVEISRLHKKLGVTMIYVTHDQTEAMTLADKIVVLRAGNIEQIGRPLDVYDDPANQFVAGFVGSPRMNFLKGKVTESGGGAVTIELTGLKGARIRKSLGEKLPAVGSAVVLGIRPEHFGDPGRGGSEITLKTDIIEHLGSTSYLYARTADGEELIVERSTSREEADREKVTVSIPASKVYLFDGSGLRLR